MSYNSANGVFTISQPGVYMLEAELEGLFQSSATFPLSWYQLSGGGVWSAIGGFGSLSSDPARFGEQIPFTNAIVTVVAGQVVSLRVGIQIPAATQPNGKGGDDDDDNDHSQHTGWIGFSEGWARVTMQHAF